MSSLRHSPPKLVIECTRCGRHGVYVRDKALRRFGNIGLQDFLFRIVTAECALMKVPAKNACAARLIGPGRHAA